jgi:hypothetical protein
MKSAPSVKEQPRGHGMERWHIAVALGATFAAYGLLAYVILPSAWTHHEHQPGLAVRAMATQTKQGIPGDPMNVGMVGSRDDVIQAMHAAGWYPADPITLRSSIAIIGSVIFHRPYEDAPVSNLYYDHRREDLAFEKRQGRARTRAIMFVSGWSSSRALKAGRFGSEQPHLIGAWGSVI